MQFWGALLETAIAQSSGNVAVTPATGHLVLTGYAPTLIQSRLVSPATGHLVLTGYAPTVAKSLVVTPTTGHLVLSGYAPQVAQTFYVTPATGHVILTGYAPSVVQSKLVTPATGHLVLTGYAPTVVQSGLIPVPTGRLVLRGYTPTVEQTNVVGFVTRGGYKKHKPRVWKNEREEIRKALRRAIDGPDLQEFEIVLAAYIEEKPGTIFDRIDWNQVGIDALAIKARFDAIVQEREDEELMLLL